MTFFQGEKRMFFKHRRRSRVAYESREMAPEPAVLTSTPALASLQQGAKFDRPLALVTTVVPAVGLVSAMVLLYHGYGGPVEFALATVMYLATMIGIDVGYHRHFTHGAFQTTLPIRVLLAILGSMAFQGPLIWWVATHRRHHQHSDQPGDPHSPQRYAGRPYRQLRGLWHAHMGWLFDPACVRAPGWARYAQDLYREATIFKVHMAYFTWLLLGLALPAMLDGMLTWRWTGVWLGLLWGGLVRLFFSSHFSWAINSLCHAYGSRPFASHDEHSTNNFWLVLPTLGEAWHNNHHAFPSSAKFGLTWWQLDPGMWCIQALAMCGLAWDIKIPTARMIEAKGGQTPKAAHPR
jgi:stearoyl-CoA desaturase (delta-9 desaturase)